MMLEKLFWLSTVLCTPTEAGKRNVLSVCGMFDCRALLCLEFKLDLVILVLKYIFKKITVVMFSEKHPRPEYHFDFVMKFLFSISTSLFVIKHFFFGHVVVCLLT